MNCSTITVFPLQGCSVLYSAFNLSITLILLTKPLDLLRIVQCKGGGWLDDRSIIFLY